MKKTCGMNRDTGLPQIFLLLKFGCADRINMTYRCRVTCVSICMEREKHEDRQADRNMDQVAETDEMFICRDAPVPDLSTEKIFPGEIKVKALFTPDMKWRLVEDFGPHCFTEADDGRLLFTADYTDLDNLVTWLMTFGAKVEVLEPAEARDMIRRNAKETLQLYMED